MGLFSKDAPAAPQYYVIITTTDHISGREVTDYLGIVSGRGFVNETFVSTDADTAKDMTRKELQLAERNLKAEAAALGANAVIGVTVQYTRARAAMLIALSGTAVIVK